MKIRSDSVLMRFANLYKNTPVGISGDTISLCDLFWNLVHSVLVSFVLVVMLIVFSFASGMAVSPVFGLNFVWGGFLTSASAVDIALVLFLGFSLIATLIACVIAIVVVIHGIVKSCKGRVHVPDKVVSVFTVVPEYISAKKAKVCPLIKIE
ncbi:hypothetical protein KAMAJI_01690 [Serratia phage vB_SmaM-Kamaji]|nr:hypothetical protein KAMAJI_01690 [Serratia phage vB_SmaM-Kamaji]